MPYLVHYTHTDGKLFLHMNNIQLTLSPGVQCIATFFMFYLQRAYLAPDNNSTLLEEGSAYCVTRGSFFRNITYGTLNTTAVDYTTREITIL